MARPLPEDERDAGTTLIEVLVTSFLVTLILTVVTQSFILGQRSTSATGIRVQDAASARVALDVMTKTLRTAVKRDNATRLFTTSQAERIGFYAINNPGGGPTFVSYYVEQNFNSSGRPALVEETTPAYGTAPPYAWRTQDTRKRALAYDARVTFTYLRPYEPGTSSTCTAALGCPVTLAGTPAAVPDASLPLLRAVGISLQVESKIGGPTTAPTTVTAQVRLPNGGSVWVP